MSHTILIADDDDSIRFVLNRSLQKVGYKIIEARNGKEALEKIRDEKISAVFLDIFMPDVNGLDLIPDLRQINPTASIIVITAHGDTQTAIDSAKRNAYDYITKPFDLKEINRIAERAINVAEHARKVEMENEMGEDRTTQKHQIVGQSAAMRRVYQMIGRAAISDETVFVMGESGTGKELIARAIHENSRRADRSFVVVDCSAIPPNLIESALFGHLKGAYTGADSARQGKFEQANGGTIFLDEVGELPIDVQMKLLRVLQEREVEPVGSDKLIRVDVRVVAATNRELQKEIENSNFREDLFYRLNVVPIYLPPLRDRKEDIPDLVDLFVSRFASEYKKPKVAVSDQVLEMLIDQHWHGNVRELENAIKRALVLCSGNILLLEHFSQIDIKSETTSDALSSWDGKFRQLIKKYVEAHFESRSGVLSAEIRCAFEKPLFETILKKTDGNRSKAAEILGLNRNTLHSKIEEYKIEV